MHQDSGYLGTELHSTAGRTPGFITQMSLDRIMQCGHGHYPLYYPESQKKTIELGIAVHDCNPSLWEPEAGRWRVGAQPGQLYKTLSENDKLKKGVEVLSQCRGPGFNP